MIRKALKKDILRINEIGSFFNKDFVKLFDIENKINDKISIILVYEEGNVIKGFLYAEDLIDNIDLLEIVVDKKYRDMFIGSKLMEYLISNYCYHGKTITLEVAINNDIALKLYKKYNFKIVNIRKKYYGDVDAYLMKR